METEFKADEVDVYSDSDWAGCKATRKSTSGGMLVVDGCCLRSGSSTQDTVATSSGEAELYALEKAAAEGLEFQAVACDLGVELRVALWVDVGESLNNFKSFEVSNNAKDFLIELSTGVKTLQNFIHENI